MELILVIVLLSIVSLYAAPRFFGKSSFSVYALQDQVISVVRQVQLGRMQSNTDIPEKDHPDRCDPNEYESDEDTTYTNFCLVVMPTCIGSSAACALSEDEQVSRSDVVSDKSFTFSIANSANPVEFDLRGNPTGLISEYILISIEDNNGSNRCEVEINSQGYVSRGDC